MLLLLLLLLAFNLKLTINIISPLIFNLRTKTESLPIQYKKVCESVIFSCDFDGLITNCERCPHSVKKRVIFSCDVFLWSRGKSLMPKKRKTVFFLLSRGRTSF